MKREHPPYRKAAFAAFYQLCSALGVSRRDGRRWLAGAIGIEERYCVIADMDETECVTVVALCNDRRREAGARETRRGR